MEYAIKTLEIEIARIEQALRVIEVSPLDEDDQSDRFTLRMQVLNDYISELQLAKWVLENTNEKEARKKHFDSVIK